MQSIHLVNPISVCLYSLVTRRHQSAPVPSSEYSVVVVQSRSTRYTFVVVVQSRSTRYTFVVVVQSRSTRYTFVVAVPGRPAKQFFLFSLSLSLLLFCFSFSSSCFIPPLWFLFLSKFLSFLLSFYPLLLLLLPLKTRKISFFESSLVLHTLQVSVQPRHLLLTSLLFQRVNLLYSECSPRLADTSMVVLFAQGERVQIGFVHTATRLQMASDLSRQLWCGLCIWC